MSSSAVETVRTIPSIVEKDNSRNHIPVEIETVSYPFAKFVVFTVFYVDIRTVLHKSLLNTFKDMPILWLMIKWVNLNIS